MTVMSLCVIIIYSIFICSKVKFLSKFKLIVMVNLAHKSMYPTAIIFPRINS